MLKKIIKKLVPSFLIGWYHFGLAFLSALLYRFPSRKLTVIGVTGTSGKTTTINLAHLVLEQTGQKVASASSIAFRIGDKEEENKLKMTMPGRFALQRFLRQANKAGCKYVILEVTSEGALQHRHRFIDFKTAVFTNLSPEHIERHGSFENYRAAKGRFFKAVKAMHILNIDDKNVDYFLQFPAKQKFEFSMFRRSTSKHWLTVENVEALEQGIRFEASSGNQRAQFNLNLIGRFNVYNALAAVCIGLSQGVSLGQASQALSQAKGVPGRMEEVVAEPFRVVVDYAFTPNALEQVYQTLKPTNLVCVLGACGGGRDKWKRPVLGKIAGEHCQQIIVTNEDPYDEEPMEIINQVADGVGDKARRILDRREAIRQALKLAQPGDTVIITGKGSEPWLMIVDGKKIPWDDRQIVREEFEKLQAS